MQHATYFRRLNLFLATAWSALLLAGAPSVMAEQDVYQTAWDKLLRQYVKEGRVAYQSLQTPAGLVHYFGQTEDAPVWAVLDGYLDNLRAVKSAQFPAKQAQLAFWINAYNACVIKGVLDYYPIKSVKDVKGFFDKIRYKVAGESLTLNEIEAKGRALGDWRIHFAIVCASSSCPFLRSEAYVADRLDDQLADQVRHFLADPSRGLRLDGQGPLVS